MSQGTLPAHSSLRPPFLSVSFPMRVPSDRGTYLFRKRAAAGRLVAHKPLDRRNRPHGGQVNVTAPTAATAFPRAAHPRAAAAVVGAPVAARMGTGGGMATAIHFGEGGGAGGVGRGGQGPPAGTGGEGVTRGGGGRRRRRAGVGRPLRQWPPRIGRAALFPAAPRRGGSHQRGEAKRQPRRWGGHDRRP